jgi:inorganic triphosphatase YgiF
MKTDPHANPFVEIELKLALPTGDPSTLAKRLAQTPVLARRKVTRLQLHNVYYDTPDQTLRTRRVALRTRRVDGAPGPAGEAARLPQWLQTLKMAGREDSALSQRGEWETPVPGDALSAKALKATPWAHLDPDGTLFKALQPCFATTFERTLWLVRRRDGSVVEVALDLGHIVAGDKTTDICELELELKAGTPAALFDVAQHIARSVALLPINTSKAGQGFALAQGTLDQPQRAQPPVLTAKLSQLEAAQRVLREMFSQFTANLNTLRTSNNPEVVHQARVGWRRFKGALRLFKPLLGDPPPPAWDSLQALLSCLGEWRNVSVALNDTLPPLAEAYAAGDARRAQSWDAMTGALQDAATLQGKAVRYALQEPAVGATLLATTLWLENLGASAPPALQLTAPVSHPPSLKRWARDCIKHLHQQLKRAARNGSGLEGQHRVRLLAKRLRYSIEALQPLLPKQPAQRWYQQAVSLQTGIGATRDLAQCIEQVRALDADRALVAFLRGVAVGHRSSAENDAGRATNL